MSSRRLFLSAAGMLLAAARVVVRLWLRAHGQRPETQVERFRRLAAV